MNKKIIVIYGGNSKEREVSIATKDSIIKALDELAYKYEAWELSDAIFSKLKGKKDIIVLNATHGTFGEDGRVQAALDILNIPYTHSAFRASQIAMDKLLSKNLADFLNINTAKYSFLHGVDDICEQAKKIMQKPFVLKPVAEGSSVGVEIVLNPSEFQLEKTHFQYGELILEEYIKGREINIAIINNKAVGVMEVIPKGLFYDYEAKYSKNSGTKYIANPSDISVELYQKLYYASEKFHNFIKCNYLSRVEFLLKDDEIYFLELNTQPGFTEKSIVPQIAKTANISFVEIIKGLLNNPVNSSK